MIEAAEWKKKKKKRILKKYQELNTLPVLPQCNTSLTMLDTCDVQEQLLVHRERFCGQLVAAFLLCVLQITEQTYRLHVWSTELEAQILDIVFIIFVWLNWYCSLFLISSTIDNRKQNENGRRVPVGGSFWSRKSQEKERKKNYRQGQQLAQSAMCVCMDCLPFVERGILTTVHVPSFSTHQWPCLRFAVKCNLWQCVSH